MTQTREALVEVMAEAIRCAAIVPHDSDNEIVNPRNTATAALLALEASGVRLVPVEITEAQMDAAINALHPAHRRTIGSALAAEYKAAVAASPYAKDTP